MGGATVSIFDTCALLTVDAGLTTEAISVAVFGAGTVLEGVLELGEGLKPACHLTGGLFATAQPSEGGVIGT